MEKCSNAFLTHHGLKIRLNHDYCTADMTDETIFAWYTSIEAFDSLRGVLAIVASFIALAVGISPIKTVVLICFAYFTGYWISQSFFDMVLLNLVYGYFYMAYQFLEKFFLPYIADRKSTRLNSSH